MSESILKEEEWRDIPGYEGSYQVSDQGRVRSLDRVLSDGRRWKGKVLSQISQPSGYLVVNLWKNKSSKQHRVHRLVMLAFVGPCPSGKEVCHRDHHKTNNKLSNLMYGTRSENHRQSMCVGRITQGYAPRHVRRSDGKVFPSINQAAHYTGIHPSNICHVLSGKCSTAGHYHWTYTKRTKQ